MSKSAPHPPSPYRRWGLDSAAGWFIGAHFAMAVTTAMAVALSGLGVVDLSMPYLFLSGSGLWLGYALGPILTSRRLGRGPRADFGTSAELKDVLPWLVAGAFTQIVLIWLLYWPILHWLVDGDPSEAAQDLFDRIDGPVDTVALIVMVVVVAPLAEEIFYRGLLLSALRYHLGDLLAVLLSSGIFALIHLQPMNIPGLFLFAVIASVLRIRTNRLGPSWFFHAGFNATTVISLMAPWERF